MADGQTEHWRSRHRITGRGASAIKYDILTALLVTAARGDRVEARLALRLSLLITARFSWRQGTFGVGLREMARMWGVTERTAKREMAEMRRIGWISVAASPARGRVAQYRIELESLMRQTMPYWEAVGPDFAARMAEAPPPDQTGGGNVVPLHRSTISDLPDEDGTGWAGAALRLQRQDPSVYGAWFAPLQALEVDAGVLTLVAPSRFVADYVRTHYRPRILAALVAENRAVRDVYITASDQS